MSREMHEAEQTNAYIDRVKQGTKEEIPEIPDPRTAMVLRALHLACTPEMPDGVRQAIRGKLVRSMGRARPSVWLKGLRWSLAGAGLFQFAQFAVPVFVFKEHPITSHLVLEYGALALAVTVAMLMAAWRPRMIHGLLPVIVTYHALISILFIAHGFSHHPGNENIHVLNVVFLAVILICYRKWHRERNDFDFL